ncbi:hypothetical protein MIMGU_mgv1a020094mg [Erythranthe guttata]|uniref:Uncharacterized protein n=1 Tax=Erythranthe guttata TaxID=4155 RepID=A0A022PTA7_ERYGU|nr:hypothetical protein MIMGU_mgv1a020094mg [Erythranthe guttata]
MAAYAALLSLKYIIQQIQLHPRPPISLHQNQADSLTDNLNFLQDFLEGYSYGSSISREAVDVLESRIKNAALAAEDLIETRVVDQILVGERVSSSDFHQDLEMVIQDMVFIKKDVMEIKENNIGIEDHLHINSSTLGGAGSSSSPSTRQNAMVGFDDLLIEVMDKLSEQQSNLRIIPIVGMGGIGKTTLARNVYAKPLIMHHFDIRAWVTVSQNYNVQDILIEILLCISKDESLESLSAKSEGELGERVHKSLWGRRYWIVLDDIWSAEAWDKVNLFFPENGQRSRIMITTRVSDVASIGSHGIVMDFLNEEKSWDLLCRSVFEDEDDCPPELEEIGKKIAKNCEGLPLSIVVIGGHLAKSKRTREHWEYISENTNTIVNLEDNERCLKVLQLSYNHLPVHLKPCFLYMGVFPEDNKIRVSCLVKLWVSEGFVKPINGKSLEVVSGEYLQELCDRNLISVHKRGSYGNIKFCSIHDLLRDLCLREAEREKFFYTLVVNGTWDVVAPCEIWNMTQLKHVNFDRLELPDPPTGGKDDEFVLGNLQTLTNIRNFKCGKEIVKRIPNINKLQIFYYEEPQGFLSYCLDNLGHLHKLESLRFSLNPINKPSLNDLVENFILPNSLKKLTLEGTYLKWEEMNTKIGLLPNLQVLKLKASSFVGAEWETVEGQFCNLRYLLINMCSDLEWWTTDSSSFPRLEHLVLQQLDKLNEIPSGIGEIPTLQSIELNLCHDDAVISAKSIFDEQEDLGLRVRVVARDSHLESLAGPNFQVETW